MKASIKKNIFLSAILLALLAVFSCGFISIIKSSKNSREVQAAVEGVSNVVLNGNWKASTTEADTYTITIPKSWISDSYNLTFTATGIGPLSKLYMQVINNAGSLSVKNDTNGKSTSYSGNVTAYTDLYVDLVEGANSFTITCASKSLQASTGEATIKIVRIDTVEEGISYGDVAIETGWGVEGYPFIIENEEQFEIVRAYPDRVYQLAGDITLTSNFTPIGTEATPFSGTFDGAGYSIYGLNIPETIFGAMFGFTKGGAIKNFTLESPVVKILDWGAVLIARPSNNTTVDNVHIVNCDLFGRVKSPTDYGTDSTRMGGFVGTGWYSSDTGLGRLSYNASSCAVVSDSTISGKIWATSTNTGFRIGAFTGDCGTFNRCTSTATVSGPICVGGLVGGGYLSIKGDSTYNNALKFTKSAVFNNCIMAGTVEQTRFHPGNYPYIGYINGYGAWLLLENNNTGVQLDIDYTTSEEVAEIGIFNSDNTVDDVTKGIVVTPTATESGYNISKFVSIGQTYIGTSTSAMMDDTSVVGITSNFGGFVIRFKMADGTYKYVSTLDQTNPVYNTMLSVNLDDLTSYVDNFNSIEINTGFGTADGYKLADSDSSVSVFGSAKISNANDFEHLSWVVNGGIPTYFNNGTYFYNGRSIVTLGVDLQADIDLTSPRYARVVDGVATLITEEEYNADSTNAYVLNQNSLGERNYEFYGFGISEMHPYRGSMEGNNHNINVNMDMPDAYMSGIIKCVTNDENGIYMQNFTVSGTINGSGMAGIVCMVDNHERSNQLYITNVTNNASVTARYLAGGILAQPHSQPQVIFENCVNNGNIYAYASTADGDAYNGSAGGICGDSIHYNLGTDTSSYITFKSCVNNGRVGSKAYIAAGFIARARVVFVDGENINRGLVYSGGSNAVKSFFIGSLWTFTSYNPSSTELTEHSWEVSSPGYTGYFKVIHEVNIGCVTEYSYTVTDSSGNVLATSAEGLATTETDMTIEVEIKDISYANFIASSINFKNQYIASGVAYTPVVDLNSGYDTLYQTISVPINIDMYSGNVYSYTISPEELYDNWTDNYSLNVSAGNNYFGSSGAQYGISTTADATTSTRSNWTLRANVYFSNGGETTRINLTPNVNTATNQLVWIKATFVHTDGIYAIPDSLAQNLYRISENLENLQYYAKTLLKATNKDNAWFKSYGENVYNRYTTIVTELEEYDSQDGYNGENMERFWWYLGNASVNLWSYSVTEETLMAYFNNIVSSADLSVLENVSVEYGKYEFTKSLTFTMVNGTTQTRNITYTFSKTDSLSATATTASGVSFSVGEVTTYTYNSDVAVTITPIDLVGITFDNAEFVYDGTAKTITAELTLLNAEDVVEFTLAYNGEASAINAGTYEVSIASLSGADGIFYNIPESYTKGSLKITPIILSVSAEEGKSYEYNQGAQATTFTLSVLSETTYEFTESDWSVVYTGTDYSSSEQPVNVGTYTATIQVNSNFTFSGNGYFTFSITPKEITGVSITEEFTYSFGAPNLNFNTFVGLIDGDEVAVSDYTIFDSKGSESTGVNYGNYTVQINSLSNSNYAIAESAKIKSFVVNKADVEITIHNRTSVYGEAIDLTGLTYDVVSGEVFEGDSLALTASPLGLTSVGEQELTATSGNDNYNAVINAGTYSITPRELTIDYGTTSFEYSSQDLYSEIISPTLTNLADGDASSFTFTLYSGENVITTFKNAGNYTLKLNENDVTANYTISSKSQDYVINQFALTLQAKNLPKRYNETILSGDFALESYVLAGQDSLADIVSISYLVLLDGQEVDYTSNLDVGTYLIKLVATPVTSEGSLYSNYLITLSDGTLTISEESTYLVASGLEQNADKFYDGIVVDYTAILYGAEDEVISSAEISYVITKDGETVSEIKGVGSYTIVITATAGENYAESTKTYSVVIKTNVITITLDSDNKTYSGVSFTPSYSFVMNKEVDLTGILTSKLLDENESEITEAVNAGNYYLSFSLSDAGYQLQKSKFAFKINQIDVAITVQDRTETYGDEFDVQSSTAQVTSGEVLENESLELVFSVADYTGVAGSYVLSATSNNPNYNVTVTNGTLTIDKRALVITYSGDAQLVYDPAGYPTLLSASVTNALTSDVYSIHYLNANGQQTTNIENAGSYSLVVELIDTTNYEFSGSSETKFVSVITISQKTMDLTIGVESKTYDGLALNISDVKVDGAVVDSSLYQIQWFSGENTISAPKSAGDYQVKIVEVDATNYKFVNNTKDVTISARVVTIANIATEYEYNRQAIKPVLELVNTIENDDVKLSYTYEDNDSGFKTVDTYTIVISGLTGVDSGNYTLSANDQITYDIVKAKVTVNIANSSIMFTNNQVTKDELGISFTGNLTILESDYSISTLPTNAGTYQIDFVANNTNIDFSITSFELVIERAEITGITFEDKSVNFNNNAHSIYVDNLTLSNGITLTASYSTNSFVDAGSYEITATLTNDNYVTKELTATLTINKVSVTVSLTTATSYSYNKLAQGYEIKNLSNLWYKDLISYNYSGENYSSTEKPINAGIYSLNISSNNENNLVVTNSQNEFTISTKGITVTSLSTQTYTFSSKEISFIPAISGVISPDEVSVKLNYNGLAKLPINAGTYEVTFVALEGANASNYHISNSDATASLVISPYVVRIVADSKSVVYGEEEVELTYASDSLLGDDVLTGELAREEGNGVGSYIISQNTLTASENYTINFVNALYTITQRTITHSEFDTNFVYNGASQVPAIEFFNIASGDDVESVVEIRTYGDTVNAGNYSLSIAVINENYKIETTNYFTVVISKLDQTSKILALVSTSRDYDAKIFEPIAVIDDDLNYTLSYALNGEAVESILNAGVYTVTVIIDEQNFKGEKAFEFTVNKIYYPESATSNARVIIAANSLEVIGLENINVGLTSLEFTSGNKLSGLEDKTTYEIFVELAESTNYKTTVFSLGEFTTTPCPVKLNAQLESFISEEINITNLDALKALLSDVENVSDLDIANLDAESLAVIKNSYEAYFDGLNEEIKKVKNVSSIVSFGAQDAIVLASSITSVLGLGLISTKGKKKYGKIN